MVFAAPDFDCLEGGQLEWLLGAFSYNFLELFGKLEDVPQKSFAMMEPNHLLLPENVLSAEKMDYGKYFVGQGGTIRF